MCQIWRILLWKSPKACQNVTIEFCFIMRIFYELRYTVIIKIVWIFYLKSVPAKFQKYKNHISWVISGISSSKLSCNPRHPSRNISCNHRPHLLQPSRRRIFSTSNNQKQGSTATSTVITRLLPLTNYISGAENETQRALLGHTNGNTEMRSTSPSLPPPPPPPPRNVFFELTIWMKTFHSKFSVLFVKKSVQTVYSSCHDIMIYWKD